jgi:hypothetical protein
MSLRTPYVRSKRLQAEYARKNLFRVAYSLVKLISIDTTTWSRHGSEHRNAC